MTVPLTVRVSEELKEAVEQAATGRNLRMNRFVAQILAEHLKRPELAVIPMAKMGRPKSKAAAG